MLAENETAGPVTKYGLLIIAVVIARMAAFSYDVSLSLYCQRVSKGGSGDTWTHNGLHYRKIILSLGNPDLLQWISSKTAWPLEQRETVKKNFPLLRKETLCPPGLFTTQTLWNKRAEPLPARCAQT